MSCKDRAIQYMLFWHCRLLHKACSERERLAGVIGDAVRASCWSRRHLYMPSIAYNAC